MRVVTSLPALRRDRPAVLTIGAFDGVHRGHQFLIRQVVDRSHQLGYESVVVTFDPRPQVVLRPGSTQLTEVAEKTRVIRALGPDTLVVLPFTPALAAEPAGRFLLDLLHHVNLAELWVGSDFAFGHDREGTVEYLVRTGQASGFAVHVIAREEFDGREMSSTAVRRHLSAGEMTAVTTLLGRFFRVPGVVVPGAGRGAELGFPTANLGTPPTQTVPGLGIYAAFALAGGDRHGAAVSVGTNPTFGGREVSIEPYLLDFSGDLRDQPLALDFVAKIRDEERFQSVEALVARMRHDVKAARQILAQADEPGALILDQTTSS